MIEHPDEIQQFNLVTIRMQRLGECPSPGTIIGHLPYFSSMSERRATMATVIQKSNKSIEIRYIDASGKRQSLYPGKIAKRDAEGFGRKIDHIVSRQIVGADPDREVSMWLSELPNRLHTKLVKKGLVAARMTPEPAPKPETAPTIKAFTDRYISEYPCGPQTKQNLELYARGLIQFFGEGKRLNQFNQADAERFRKWLGTNGSEQKGYMRRLSPNTVATRIKKVKQFFNFAVKDELIASNPFAGESANETANEERMIEVPTDWVDRMIAVAHDEDFRLMLALARYGGLRRHELSIHRWEDIDIPNARMTVSSTKTGPATSRFDSDGRRIKIRKDVPIFRELMPHILRARELAEPGQELLQPSYDRDTNLTKMFDRCCARAGLHTWTKPWQNMRATRQTDLLDAQYQIKVVCQWFGNSPKVAEKHYLMIKREEAERAVEICTASELEKTPLNPPPTVQDKGGNSGTQKKPPLENPANSWVCLVTALGDLPLSYPART